MIGELRDKGPKPRHNLSEFNSVKLLNVSFSADLLKAFIDNDITYWNLDLTTF
jgi:hypothetical protein